MLGTPHLPAFLSCAGSLGRDRTSTGSARCSSTRAAEGEEKRRQAYDRFISLIMSLLVFFISLRGIITTAIIVFIMASCSGTSQCLQAEEPAMRANASGTELEAQEECISKLEVPKHVYALG